MSGISRTSLFCWSLVVLAVIYEVNSSPYKKYPSLAREHGNPNGAVDVYRDRNDPGVLHVQGCFNQDEDDYIPLLDKNNPAYDPENPAINPQAKGFDPRNKYWKKLQRANRSQLHGCVKHEHAGILGAPFQLADDWLEDLAGK